LIRSATTPLVTVAELDCERLRAEVATFRDLRSAMAKKAKKKKPPAVSTKRAKGWELLRARDAAYRDALDIKPAGELPKSLGVTTPSGGGRDRRGRIEKPSKHDPTRRGRVKLIG
jgi:hypothetical protein